jgi:hypothetical protein
MHLLGQPRGGASGRKSWLGFIRGQRRPSRFRWWRAGFGSLSAGAGQRHRGFARRFRILAVRIADSSLRP